jgi:hypothetical protein
MARGARNTAITARLIAVSTRSSNAELPCRGLADFACAIHSQHIAAQENRAGGIAKAIRKMKNSFLGLGVGQQASPIRSRSLLRRSRSSDHNSHSQ